MTFGVPIRNVTLPPKNSSPKIFASDKWFVLYCFCVARLCNGSTTDFESVCLGSNPSLATTLFHLPRTQQNGATHHSPHRGCPRCWRRHTHAVIFAQSTASPCRQADAPAGTRCSRCLTGSSSLRDCCAPCPLGYPSGRWPPLPLHTPTRTPWHCPRPAPSAACDYRNRRRYCRAVW